MRIGGRFAGKPIKVRYAAGLRDTAGNQASAATFIPQRLIVLDAELRSRRGEHSRILTHELLHFAWVRLGNPRRKAWEEMVAKEWHGGVRGEAGWSAEWRKTRLQAKDVDERTRRWREYCCEAFCDTGAWLWSGVESENTLARRARRKRSAWFGTLGLLAV